VRLTRHARRSRCTRVREAEPAGGGGGGGGGGGEENAREEEPQDGKRDGARSLTGHIGTKTEMQIRILCT